MALVVGIDEVGYGPKLGPLVVCAYAFRTADPSRDLWKSLAPLVGRAGQGRPLTVADSKQVYSPSRGLAPLERTALPFAALLSRMDVGSLRGLAGSLAVGSDGALASPWYRGEDRLPHEISTEIVDGLATLAWNACLQARVMPAGCWAAWAEPDAFNRYLAGGRNKSDFLFDRACALIRAALDTYPAGPAEFHIGRQGGRRFYLPGLVREFGSVWVRDERPEASRYEFVERGRRVRADFLVDGEEARFEIALASMIGKYLRECAMHRFNAWFAERRPGLRRTAGYGADGTRFFREVEAHLPELDLRPEQVLRAR